jgi:cysteine desulfurase
MDMAHDKAWIEKLSGTFRKGLLDIPLVHVNGDNVCFFSLKLL